MITTTVTKWQEAYEILAQEIDTGVFQPGAAFISIKDVCERFSFSTITARRVFDELKAGNRIRARQRRHAIVLGPSQAEGLAVAQPQTVLLCYRAYGAGFDAAQSGGHAPHVYHELLRGFQRSPFDRLFRIKPVSIDFCLSHPKAVRNASVLMNQEVLFTPGDTPHIDTERVRRVREILNPIVFHVLVPKNGMTEVRLDKAAGKRAMIDCLAQAGHRRIGYLGSTPAKIWSGAGFQGYLEGLTAHDLPFNPEWIGITVGNDPERVRAAITRLMSASPKPTAVVCGNDARALTVLAWCREQGINVPGDLAVTGSGNMHEAELCTPPLTSVDDCADEVGFAALDLLRRRQAGTLTEPAKVTIQPRVVLRASHGGGSTPSKTKIH